MPLEVREDIDSVLARICSSRPALQVDGQKQLADYGIDPRLVPFLRAHVVPGSRTIETGSGLSTMLFLLFGCEHVAISPDAGEPSRIREHCAEHGIAVDRYTAITAFSEDVLPSWPAGPPFDFALIDGNHAFPAPSIDWFYLTRLLKESAVVVVDDVHLWPCRILADFLDEEEVWQRLARNERFAAYRLLVDPAEALSRWWGKQPYVRRRASSRARLAFAKRAPRLSRWLRLQ